MRGSGSSKSGWSKSGRNRRSGSGVTVSVSSRLKSTGVSSPAQGPGAPACVHARPKGVPMSCRSRRKQQTLEAEEAKRRLQEQSIFVSS